MAKRLQRRHHPEARLRLLKVLFAGAEGPSGAGFPPVWIRRVDGQWSGCTSAEHGADRKDSRCGSIRLAQIQKLDIVESSSDYRAPV